MFAIFVRTLTRIRAHIISIYWTNVLLENKRVRITTKYFNIKVNVCIFVYFFESGSLLLLCQRKSF